MREMSTAFAHPYLLPIRETPHGADQDATALRLDPAEALGA